MLRTIRARKCPPVIQQHCREWHEKERTPVPFLRDPLSSSQVNSRQRTPDTSASVQAALKHTLMSLSSPFP